MTVCRVASNTRFICSTRILAIWSMQISVSIISRRMERRYLVDASQTEKERKRLEARNREIDGMFLSQYTDKAKGILTEQRFMKLTAALEQEQEANQDVYKRQR